MCNVTKIFELQKMKRNSLSTTTSDSTGRWNFGTFMFPKQYYYKKQPSISTHTQRFFKSVTPEKEKCKPVKQDDSEMDLCEDEEYKVDLSKDVFKWSTPPCVQKSLDSMPSFLFEPLPELESTPIIRKNLFTEPRYIDSPNSNDSTYFDNDQNDFDNFGSMVVCETKKLTQRKILMKCFKEVMSSSCDYLLREGEMMQMLLESTKVFIYKGDPFMSYGSTDFPTTYKDSVILGFGLLKQIKDKDNDQITLLVSKKGFEYCLDTILTKIKWQTKKGRILYAFTDFSKDDQRPFFNSGFKGDTLDERGAMILLRKYDIEIPRIYGKICPVFSITV